MINKENGRSKKMQKKYSKGCNYTVKSFQKVKFYQVVELLRTLIICHKKVVFFLQIFENVKLAFSTARIL